MAIRLPLCLPACLYVAVYTVQSVWDSKSSPAWRALAEALYIVHLLKKKVIFLLLKLLPCTYTGYERLLQCFHER